MKCVVVRDTITSRGKPVERTFDWYTQDKHGNVWYFGENSKDYRHGHWVKSDGSWEAGVHGAQPGIMMEAHPKRGDAYRQEYYRGHAEDQAKVLGKAGRVTVPAGTYRHTIATKETSRLEPGVVEKKWYARGVGEIKSQDVKGSKEGFRLVKVHALTVVEAASLADGQWIWPVRQASGDSNWRSGCPDSNRGSRGPRPRAMTRLRYTPRKIESNQAS